MMKNLQALALIGVILSVVHAGKWQLLTRQQNYEIFDFDPATAVIEFKIKPLGSRLEDLHFNLVSRMYGKSGRMKSVVSYMFQMKGDEVVRSLVRLGVRMSEKAVKYCYDRRVIKSKLAQHLSFDIASGNVVTIDNTKEPNFEKNRVCKPWRDLIQSNSISRAAVGLWDYNQSTYDKIVVHFRIITLDAATITSPIPDITFMTTRSPENIIQDNPTSAAVEASSGDICSLYPNGVLETFDKVSSHYDMMCYHVIAANIGSGLTPSWFIYGAYDELDGIRSLRSLAFYLGSKTFELQRGWMVNNNGDKFYIKEGEDSELPGSGCRIFLKNFYITADCRPGGYPFVAHYDGHMLGHIELFQRSSGNIGLCFKNSKGMTVNWQLPRQPQCARVTPDIQDCKTNSSNCGSFEDACDDSLVRACREMSCGGNLPTSEQICSLSLAKKRKCQFAGTRVKSELVACPADLCLRKFFVLGIGCPQDSFVTGCPMEKYLNQP